MCDGTGGPQRCEGGRRGPQRGGAEERGPTETEERRLTGQHTEASFSDETGSEELQGPDSGGTVSAAQQQSAPDLLDLKVDMKHKVCSSSFSYCITVGGRGVVERISRRCLLNLLTSDGNKLQ